MTTNMFAHEAVTICQCSDGIATVHGDGHCLPEEGGLEEVAKLYEDVWFLEFDNVTVAMLVFLAKFPFIQETLECLQTRKLGRRFSYSQLLAKATAQWLIVVRAIGGMECGDWRTDIVSMNQELALISDTGTIYEDE